MKFKLRIKEVEGDHERIEEYDSENLYLVMGSRVPKRVVFDIEAETREEFERFGTAMIENYNKFCHPNNRRELVEVIIDA